MKIYSWSRLKVGPLLFLLGLGLLLTVLQLGISYLLYGTIRSPALLSQDLHGEGEQPQLWHLSEVSPFRYRWLFQTVVSLLFHATSDETDGEAFLLCYVAVSGLCLWATFFFTFLYLQALDLSKDFAVRGCVLLLCTPALLYAYRYPVHTREDPMLYAFLAYSFWGYARGNVWRVCIGLIGAVSVRETGLVAALPMLFNSSASWTQRLLPFVIGSSGVVLPRVVLGYESYDPFPSAAQNYSKPLESIGFIFLIFGALWIPFLGSIRSKSSLSALPSYLSSSLIPALVLTFGTTLLCARIREIRICFILFPWVLPYAVVMLRQWQPLTLPLRVQLLAVFCAAIALALPRLFHWWTNQALVPTSSFGALRTTDWRMMVSLQLGAAAYFSVTCLMTYFMTSRRLASSITGEPNHLIKPDR